MHKIYLDHNATSPLRPEARAAMMAALDAPHNASSVHSYGRGGRKIIEDARARVAALVNAPPAQVIFNSGATEGNNTVLKFFAGERILISAIEHPSVSEVVPNAERIPVTGDGIVDLDALQALLSSPPSVALLLPPPMGGRVGVGGQDKPALVSVMLANNETGAIQPIQKIAELAHSHGALFHCDATQGAGRIPIDIAAMGVDFLTISSHKIGGPQGVGALVLGLCGVTPVLLQGGGQEKKARAGTENVAAIAGFGAAAQNAGFGIADESARLLVLREQLESSLSRAYPEIIIHAAAAPRLPNTTMFSLPGAKAETALMALDLEGIAVSNGSACSSGTVKPSHVLKAMGCDDGLSSSALRVSLGWNTAPSDIEKFMEAFSRIAQRFRDKKAAHG